MLAIEAAIAKTSKYAVPESGDTAEVVERPGGGLSIIMADGQRSGRSAKAISNLVVRKAASLVLEGVRDGAAARAASDYLLVARRGQVSADMVIISADLATRSLVITRNTRCPVVLYSGSEVRSLAKPSSPLGISRLVRPEITEIPLASGLCLVGFSDGVWEAGTRSQRPVHPPAWMTDVLGQCSREPRRLADAVLDTALQLDSGRPRDDMTVVVLVTRDYEESPDVRRLHVIYPAR